MMTKPELYTVKCHECQKVFKTFESDATFCPDCLKYRQPRKPSRKRKAAKKTLTIAEILHITKVYNKINHKYLHYGEIVVLLDQNVDRCVCCGEIVPEGRQVCLKCEKAVE